MPAAFNVDLVGACERIRKEASSLAGENYAFNLKRKTGALDFITSPKNMMGVDSTLISWDNGKKIGTLKVLYDQRTKSCQIGSDTATDVCDTGSRPARKQFLVDIEDFVHTPVRTFSNDDMVVICKDTETFVRERLASDIRAAHEFLDEKILAELLAARGKNYEFDGTTTAAGANKTLDIIDSTGTQPIPLPGNFADVLLDYQNNQLTGKPAIIGQGNIEKYAKLDKMSCCNSATPYGEADSTAEADIYIDQAGNSVLGANNAIVAAYGAMHLVTFNENANIGINTPTHQNIVIDDPSGYPMKWNLDFYWDTCSKSWKYMISLHYTVFNLFQADSFSANDDASPDVTPDCDDELRGMLGVFGYQFT